LPNNTLSSNYKNLIERYEVLTKEETDKIDESDYEYMEINSRIHKYNEILSNYCKLYNIKFCNINKYLFNSEKYVDELFLLKHNELSFHMIYEFILFVYLKKL
jgi:uncharacterized coiled-coil DUF342 family protein